MGRPCVVDSPGSGPGKSRTLEGAHVRVHRGIGVLMSEQWGTPPPAGRPELTPYDRSYVAGAELSRELTAGWRPPAQPVNMALAADEHVFGQARVQLLDYSSQQVAYNGGGFLAFGNPLLTIATVAGSAAYNTHQKKKAEAQAAAQWRLADVGYAFFTDQRIALMGGTGWADLYYGALRSSSPDLDGIVLMVNGTTPTKLVLWPQHWFYGLLRFLAYGEIVAYRDIPPHLLPYLRERRRDPPALN